MRATDPKRRIVRAAVAEFAAHGVDATSVQRVAARARMSKQALMHHYPTKAALRRAAFAEIAERVEALFPAAAADITSAESARHARVIDVVATQFEENPDVARFLLRELLDRPRETRAAIAKMTAPWLSVVTQVVDDAPRAQRLDAEAHVTALATLLLAHAALVTAGPAGASQRAARRRRLREAVRRVLRVSSHIP